MNVEIVIKDIESKQSELIEVDLSQAEVDPRYLVKQDPDKLPSVIMHLIKWTEKVRILVIKKIKNENHHEYSKPVAEEYLKYFTHVVFLDDSKIFYGFAKADALLKKIQSLGDTFLKEISEWILNSPIRNDICIIKGASRKQVLDKMKELGLDVLPVISGDRSYVGVLDRDSIMSQITRDFYNYAKNPKGLPEF
jgi:predicted transcriptional regulator